MISLPDVKRGETFYYYMQMPFEVDIEKLTSQIRDGADRLICNVKIESTADLDIFKLSVEDTSNWPIKKLITDVRWDDNGVIRISPTISINVVKDVTRNG